MLDPDLESAKQGDADAFARLIVPLERRMYQLALGITGNPEDAQDSWQNTLLKAWQNLPQLRESGAFAVWLTRIVLNEARRVRRRQERHRLLLQLLSRHRTESSSFPPEYEDVLACLQKLRPNQKEIILLRYWSDLALEDIAEITGRPLNTTKTVLYRALTQLRRLLQENYPSPAGGTFSTKAGCLNQLSPGEGEEDERVRSGSR